MKRKINSFVKYLRKQQLTLALAESITCGMAAAKLATCVGTSDILTGSIVCYMPEVKIKLLKVPERIIEKYTCESKQVTTLLATHLSGLIKADIYAALTGLASEGGSETKDKPVGTVFFCVRYKGRIYHLRKVFKGSPLKIREKACMELYAFILSKVK